MDLDRPLPKSQIQLSGLCKIPDKEVNQDGIDRHHFRQRRVLVLGELFRFLLDLLLDQLQDSTTDQFYGPDRVSTDLDLEFRTIRQELTSIQDLEQLGRVLETVEMVQGLRHSVIRKHGDLVNVFKMAIVLVLETGPEIRHENLRTLEDLD